MKDYDFQFACTMFDNRQRMIAAGKSQRWDVVKWTVTVNIALAAAAIAFRQQASAGMQLSVLSVFVAAAGLLLMLYYNLRLARTRNESVVTEEYLADNGIAFSAIVGCAPQRVGWFYDWQELITFALVQWMSVIPTVLVWKLAT